MASCHECSTGSDVVRDISALSFDAAHRSGLILSQGRRLKVARVSCGGAILCPVAARSLMTMADRNPAGGGLSRAGRF